MDTSKPGCCSTGFKPNKCKCMPIYIFNYLHFIIISDDYYQN